MKRVSDRLMSLKLEMEGIVINVVNGYAPQVGCELEEKQTFLSEVDYLMQAITRVETLTDMLVKGTGRCSRAV